MATLMYSVTHYVTSDRADIKLCYRCVQRFQGHVNRAYHCGVAISPCSRFIASGSEDRAVSGAIVIFLPFTH